MLYTLVVYCVLHCNENDSDLQVTNLTKASCERLAADIKKNYAWGGNGTVVGCYEQGTAAPSVQGVER